VDQAIADWRRSERSRLLAIRKQPDAAQYAVWAESITASLAEHMISLAPEILGFYSPFGAEYDPMPVVGPYLDRGGRAALPVVVARGQPLEYRPWRPGVAMAPGKFAFGIAEPVGGPAVIPDLMLVPLLGFDGAGYRLGYGGGYFDRTLAAYPVRPKTIGVGFEIGRLPTIHPQPHDIPLDMIVTEAGVFTAR
jgi:5-formyltetrahydrofolate cyclo-ligase